jgi:hypothetical protein
VTTALTTDYLSETEYSPGGNKHFDTQKSQDVNSSTDVTYSIELQSQELSTSSISLMTDLFPTDKALFEPPFLCCVKDFKSFLVTKGPCKPVENDMPMKEFPTESENIPNPRRFKSSLYSFTNTLGEFVQHKWLAYSYRKNYAYCHACWLFGENSTQQSAWVKGTYDWKNVSKSIHVHSNSASHRRSMIALSNFAADKSIDFQLKKQVDKEVEKWRHVLTVQFGLIRILGALGLPFRGHREDIVNDHSNPGVYLSLLKFISTVDPVLANHFQSESRIKYLSKTITDEQINILGSNIREKIVSDCNESHFFTVIADSTTDISHKDQLAILLRFVNIDYSSKTVEINESFIGYYHCKNATARGICDIIKTVLFDDLKLQKRSLKGQAYDGASVMSGPTGGVQALMKKDLNEEGSDFLPYVHCPPHQLNLVLLHAAESGNPPPPVDVPNFFSLVQDIYTFFSASNRRWDLLLTEASNSVAKAMFTDIADDPAMYVDAPQSEETSKIYRLQSLSTTRWASRSRAIYALSRNFLTIIHCTTILIEERHDCHELAQASTINEKMDWTFLFNVVWWNKVLQIINSLSRLLQSKTNDLHLVCDCFAQTTKTLKDIRTEKSFNDFVDEAKKLWLSYNFSENDACFKTQRIRRVKRMPGEVAFDEAPIDTEQKYRVDVYFRVLDNIIGEMSTRTEGMKQICEQFGFLMPERLRFMSYTELEVDIQNLVNRFKVSVLIVLLYGFQNN